MGEGLKAKNTAYCKVYAREEEEEHLTRHEKRRRNDRPQKVMVNDSTILYKDAVVWDESHDESFE